MHNTISKKRLIKLTIAAIFFSGVLLKYNEQRPALKSKREVTTQSTNTTPSRQPNSPIKQANKQAMNVVTKELASALPTTQKRYYLLDTPNDPYYSSSWHLQTINAPSAWAVTNTSDAVTVADIDSGFALAHQDLITQWKTNPNEVGDGKESNGIDDDDNGLIDDYRGWDFANNDNNPQAGSENPTGQGVSHGSETAGLIGAASNNGIGMSSVARNVSILPLQVIDDNGSGYSDDVAQAIIYAVDQGVAVINMSLGTNGDDPQVRSAINYAFENNVIVVAAAGNCGVSTTGACSGQVAGYVTFPANYNRVIAVGATDSSNNRASFSSYGERVDLMAPGSGSIASTTWTGSNGTSSYTSSLFGTSYASPIVASSAALIRSIRPSTSIDDVRALLMASARKLTPMGTSFYTQAYGHGLLDIGKSIQVADELNTSGELEPALLQTGGMASEHTYTSSDNLGSGCVATTLTWCTVWLRNDGTNYERFLPYTKTNADGQAGWNYTAASLNKGIWESLARQGTIVSTTAYPLYKK